MSAGGLAAARGVDLFFERVEADRADDDVAADPVARCAVKAERLGQLEAFLELPLDLLAPHVLFDASHVEADFFRDGQRTRLVRRAAAAEQLLVEFQIFLARFVLHANGGSDLRGLYRSLAQDWKLLEHE